jgi:hypothetical protein
LFRRKPMNTKVWKRFRATQFRHQICIIWSPDVGDMTSARKDCEIENLGEADFMETKFASLSRKISCKKR